MKIIKNVFCLLFLLMAFISSANGQDVGTDLFFLKGETKVKFEFNYDGLTISGEPEKPFVEKDVDKMNKKKTGDGNMFYYDWEKEKSTDAPESFISRAQKYLLKYHFDADNVFKDEPKYICVVKLISIKKGIRNLITPTLWVSYTFYLNNNRDKPLAILKYHIAYGHGSSHTDLQDHVSGTSTSSWDNIYMAYEKAGAYIAKKIIKGASLRK